MAHVHRRASVEVDRGPRRSRGLFKAVVCAVALSTPLGCAARSQGRAPVEQPTRAVGELNRVDVDIAFDGKALTTKIQNNTNQSLTLTTTVQALTVDGVDAMTPIVGPHVTVPAGVTSQGLVVELPTIADGYYRVTSTATASAPAGVEQGGAQLFIHVQSGTAREIEWAEWDDKTGDGPVVPG